MKFFLDTEFFDDGTTIWPISIGIVTEDGRECYLELISRWKPSCDPWILENVIPQLEGTPIGCMEARKVIWDFIGAEPAEFWAYWAAYDWVVLCQTMGGLLRLPKNVSPWIRDLAWLDPTLKRIRALDVPNLKPHHALHDARQLRQQYFALQTSADVEK